MKITRDVQNMNHHKSVIKEAAGPPGSNTRIPEQPLMNMGSTILTTSFSSQRERKGCDEPLDRTERRFILFDIKYPPPFCVSKRRRIVSVMGLKIKENSVQIPQETPLREMN
jgi:hypothetical protein